jgi:Mn2+/Fe2+ NRAMP family transporter
VANVGTICAEFAGVAAGMEVLAGTSRYVTVPTAAVAVSVLVLKGSFRSVEHVLLALSAIFVTLHRLRLPRPSRLGPGGARHVAGGLAA